MTGSLKCRQLRYVAAKLHRRYQGWIYLLATYSAIAPTALYGAMCEVSPYSLVGAMRFYADRC